MYENLIGKKVLIRSNKAGVYFGTLEKVENTTVRVSSVRNIWYWDGATCLSQIANDGIKQGRVSQIVKTMVIFDVCQIIFLQDKAIKNLEAQPIWKK